MSTYVESKKALDKIRSEYDCKGELIFRQAIQYVMDYGASNLKDDWNYEHIKQDINEYHYNADAEGKNLFFGRNFELGLLECARAIAQVDLYDVLVYIQKEVWLSHEGGIDYDRAVELLKKCIYDIEERENCEDKLLLQALDDIGFDDDDIEKLGFAYLLNDAEEEN